jgi:hypothetical protein
MYAGCVAGAIQKEDYLGYIKDAGFQNIMLQKEKSISIPEDILSKYLNPQEITEFNSGETGIFSITVYAEKPGDKISGNKILKNNCLPESGCC